MSADTWEIKINGPMGPNKRTNKIVTSKYSINPFSLNFFLYKNLFEQFMRLANLYFLLIAALQIIPGLSPTGLRLDVCRNAATVCSLRSLWLSHTRCQALPRLPFFQARRPCAALLLRPWFSHHHARDDVAWAGIEG